MAIKLDEVYAGRVDTTDPNYTYGKPRNKQGDIDGTGTPYEELYFQDISGAFQALLAEGDITPSGNPDNATNSDIRDAILKMIRKPLVLKIFQSPTDGGLTEISTRTLDSGEVYEVRKVSDDSLATIYSDEAGTAEIVQNGTSNVSGNDGVVVFFVAVGSYYIDVSAIQKRFNVNQKKGFYTLQEAIDEDAEVGTTYNVSGNIFVVESSPLTHSTLSHLTSSGNYLNYKPASDVKLSASGANNITDSYQAIYDTFAYAAELGKWIDGDNKEYLTEQLVSNDIDIRLKNATMVTDIAQVGFDFGSKTAIVSTSLNSNSLLGQKSFDVVSAAGVQSGDIVVLVSDRIWPYDITRALNAGEVAKVESVSGNTITLEANLKDGYTVLENVVVSFYRPITFELENVEFKRKTREEKSSFSVRRCTPKIRNLTLRDNGQSGGNLSACYLPDVQGLCLYDNYVDGTATGYGLQDNGSLGTQIRGLVAKGNRRAIDFSGSIPSKLGSVDGFYVVGVDSTGSCLGTHGTCIGAEFRNGICDGGLIGIQIRSPLSVLENVTFVNTETRNITLSYTMSLKVVNCKSEPMIAGVTEGSIAATTSRFIEVSNLPDTLPSSEWLEVYGCSGSVRTVPIRITPSVDGIKYLRIKDNNFRIRASSAGDQLNFIASTSTASITDSLVLNNAITSNLSGVQNSLLSDNISISTSSRLIIQPITIDDSALIDQYAGDGALSNKVLDLKMSSDGEFCSIKGTVKFTVSGATAGSKLRIQGVLQKSDELKTGYISVGQSSTATINEYLISIFNREDIYLAADGWRASGSDTESFANGDYYINIDVTYPLRFPYQFGVLS